MIGFDHAAYLWVVAHRIIALDGVMWALSAIGRGGLIWFTVALVLTLRRRFQARNWVQLAFVFLTTTLVVDHLVKPVIGRERPFVGMRTVHVIGGRPSDASFPSGHAANSVAGAWTLTRVVPDAAPWYWLLAVAIAYSRIYLGVHYPLDVVGGAMLGLACAALVDVGLTQWWAHRA
jgi:undecaprenyl-diphosphatase